MQYPIARPATPWFSLVQMIETATTLKGSTKVYAVLGQPVRHSLSPLMHNAALSALGLDAAYLAFEIDPDHLMEGLQGMKRLGFGGCNLTVPHKEVVLNGVDRLDGSAALLGSANTIVFEEDGTLTGHNTDGYGILASLQESFDVELAGKHVLIVGCGGAGQAAARVAADAGAGSVRLANRSRERLERVTHRLKQDFPDTDVRVSETWPPPPEETREADVVIQSTTIGMKPDDGSPLTAEHFHAGQAVLDMVYVKPQTPFLQEAAAAGAQVTNGLGMLLHQGAKALEIWTGKTAPVDVMRAALKQHVYGSDA